MGGACTFVGVRRRRCGVRACGGGGGPGRGGAGGGARGGPAGAGMARAAVSVSVWVRAVRVGRVRSRGFACVGRPPSRPALKHTSTQVPPPRPCAHPRRSRRLTGGGGARAAPRRGRACLLGMSLAGARARWRVCVDGGAPARRVCACGSGGACAALIATARAGGRAGPPCCFLGTAVCAACGAPVLGPFDRPCGKMRAGRACCVPARGR